MTKASDLPPSLCIDLELSFDNIRLLANVFTVNPLIIQEVSKNLKHFAVDMSH